jgi:hypothetical protein
LLELLTPLKEVVQTEKDAAAAAKIMGSAIRDMSKAALEAAKAQGELAAIDLDRQLLRIREELFFFIKFLDESSERAKELKEQEANLTVEQNILGKSLFRINKLLRETEFETEKVTTVIEELGTETGSTAGELNTLNTMLERAAARANPLWGELTKLNQTTEELNVLLKAGSIDLQTYNKWLDIARQGFADAQTEAQGLGSVLEEIAVTAERMGDAQVDEFGVLDSLKLELELQGLGNTERIKRIALLEADATATSKVGKEIIATIDEIAKNDLAEQFNGAILSSTNRFFDAFLDGTLSAKEAFAGFAKSVLADIARIIIQNAILNASGGGTGGIGGAIASLFGPGRAAGGRVSGGKLHPVTELGQPELLDVGNQRFLIPPQGGGNVVPINQAKQGGGNTFNTTVNLPATTQRRTAQQTAFEVDRIQKRASSRNR